jgi:hypothetical protein
MTSDFEEKYILGADECKLLFQAMPDKKLASILWTDGHFYKQQELQAIMIGEASEQKCHKNVEP